MKYDQINAGRAGSSFEKLSPEQMMDRKKIDGMDRVGNGFEAVSEIQIGKGLTERAGYGPDGSLFREYLKNGVPVKRVELIDGEEIRSVSLAENGEPVREVRIHLNDGDVPIVSETVNGQEICEAGIKKDITEGPEDPENTGWLSSAVETISDFVDGKVSAERMAVTLLSDVREAAETENGKELISKEAAEKIKPAAAELINGVCGMFGSELVSFTIDTVDDAVDLVQGKIDRTEFVIDMLDNVAEVELNDSDIIEGGINGAKVGSKVGAAIGGAVGQFVRGEAGKVTGTAIGTVAGAVIGGAVGCVMATEAYQTAVQTVKENAGVWAEKAADCAENIVNSLKDNVPEMAEKAGQCLNNFFDKVGIFR